MTCRAVTAVQASAVAGLVVLAAGLAGCAQAAHGSGAPAIKLASAYVMRLPVPGIIDGYLVIENSGSADRLLTVRSSAGGTVALRGHAGLGTSAVRTVSALSIPGHSLVRLDPSGIHLVITQSGPMRVGTDITLTLVFARAGTVQVSALVTSFQTGGDSYLGP